MKADYWWFQSTEPSGSDLNLGGLQKSQGEGYHLRGKDANALLGVLLGAAFSTVTNSNDLHILAPYPCKEHKTLRGIGSCHRPLTQTNYEDIL